MGGKTKAAAITKKAVAQRKRERAEAKKVKEAARLERARVEREARSPAEQALWLRNEGNPMVSRYSVRASGKGMCTMCCTSTMRHTRAECSLVLCPHQFQNWFPGSVQSRNGGYYGPCQWG